MGTLANANVLPKPRLKLGVFLLQSFDQLQTFGAGEVVGGCLVESVGQFAFVLHQQCFALGDDCFAVGWH